MLNKLLQPALTANNGAEALEIISKFHTIIHCALIDLNMPLMDGYMLCKELKKQMRDHKIKEFPLIALTGEEKNDVMDICRNTGFTDVMTKPISINEMKALLKIKKPKLKSHTEYLAKESI